MALAWTLLGVAVISLALRDIFDVLFHPAGHAVVARQIIRGVRAVAARLPGSRSGLLVGPTSYILVVAGWAALLAVGWALVWMPQMPDGFTFSRGLDPSHHSAFIDALYVSLVNLSSLGYGDIAPAAALLRILGPLETLFGLGLLTASISWLISIYNAISRRDALADEVHLARETEERLGEKLAEADPRLLESMLASFADQLIRVRRDLIHFPISHYFRTPEEERSLAHLLPYLRALSAEALDEGRPHELRVRAEVLRMAIEDYAATLRGRLFLGGATTDETLERYRTSVPGIAGRPGHRPRQPS
jgi:hypothetical protein